MQYTIGQVAEKTGISTYTLRYYDKEGLLPCVKRDENGIRLFDEDDLNFLHVIDCLKHTGMSLKDIRQYIEWVGEGDSTIPQRYQLFQKQMAAIDEQMRQLAGYRACLAYKCAYYREAAEAGTEAVHWGDAEEMALSVLAKQIHGK